MAAALQHGQAAAAAAALASSAGPDAVAALRRRAAAFFTLDVLAQDVTLLPIPSSSLHEHGGDGAVALAFQFLDYPLLLLYPSADASSSRWAGWAAASASSIEFGGGKSCVLEADADELADLVHQVPLYVHLLSTRAASARPHLLASGGIPLLISAPPHGHAPSPHGPGGTLQHTALRTVTLLAPDGAPAAVARVRCRLTQHGSARPPPLASVVPAHGPHTTTRPHTAPQPLHHHHHHHPHPHQLQPRSSHPTHAALTHRDHHQHGPHVPPAPVKQAWPAAAPAAQPWQAGSAKPVLSSQLNFAAGGPKGAHAPGASGSGRWDGQQAGGGGGDGTWHIAAGWQQGTGALGSAGGASAAIAAWPGQENLAPSQTSTATRGQEGVRQEAFHMHRMYSGAAELTDSVVGGSAAAEHVTYTAAPHASGVALHVEGGGGGAGGELPPGGTLARAEAAARAALQAARQSRADAEAPLLHQAAMQGAWDAIQSAAAVILGTAPSSPHAPARKPSPRPHSAAPTASRRPAVAAATVVGKPAPPAAQPTRKPAAAPSAKPSRVSPMVAALLKHAGQPFRHGPNHSALPGGYHTAMRAAGRAGAPKDDNAGRAGGGDDGGGSDDNEQQGRRSGGAQDGDARGGSPSPRPWGARSPPPRKAAYVPPPPVPGEAWAPLSLAQGLPARGGGGGGARAGPPRGTKPGRRKGPGGGAARQRSGGDGAAPPAADVGAGSDAQQAPYPGEGLHHEGAPPSMLVQLAQQQQQQHGGAAAAHDQQLWRQPHPPPYPNPHPHSNPHGHPAPPPPGGSGRASGSGYPGPGPHQGWRPHAAAAAPGAWELAGHGAPQPAPAAGAFQMSSVLMWEVMSLVCMRSVLSAAVSSMHSSMAGVAQQVVTSAFAPLASLGAQQQYAAQALAALQAGLPGVAGVPLAAAAGGGGGGAQSAFAFAAPAGFPPLETPGAVGRGAHPAGAAQPGSARAPGVTSSGTFAPALLHMPSATPSEDGAVHVAAAATRAMLALPRSDTIAVRVGGGAGGGATVPPSALRASQTLGTVPQSPNAGAMSPRGRAPPIAASSASQRNLSPVQSSSSGRERAGASGSPAETVREETYSQDGFASPATQSPHDEAPPRGLQQNAKQQANKPAPVQVGWTRSSTFMPGRGGVQPTESRSASEVSYEGDFEEVQGPATQRIPPRSADGGTAPPPAWGDDDDDIPEENLVQEVHIQPSGPSRSTGIPASRRTSVDTAALLADTEDEASTGSNASTPPGARPRAPNPAPGARPAASAASRTGTQTGAAPSTPSAKPALKSPTIKASSRKSLSGRTRRTEKGGSSASDEQDLSTESSDGLPLNQALSPNQKKAVGFRAANSTHSISRDGGHDDVDDDDEDGGSGSSGGGGGGALQRRRSIAMSEVSFFSSVASSFDEDEEAARQQDEDTESAELFDTLRPLQKPVPSKQPPTGKPPAGAPGAGAKARASRTGSMRSSSGTRGGSGGGKRISNISGTITFSDEDISWGDSDDDISTQQSINIVGTSPHGNLQQRVSMPPPPRRMTSGQRDSSKSFFITASDLSDSSGSSLEFDAEELASGLDDPEVMMIAKRRSHMGEKQTAAAQPPRPKTSMGWNKAVSKRVQQESDELGETADILEEISNLS